MKSTVLALSLLLCISCATFQKNARDIEQGIDTAVSVAMAVWNVYVAEGTVSPGDIAKVAHAHDIYVAAKKVFDDFMAGYSSHPDAPALNAALSALSNSAAAIADLIVEIVPPNRAQQIPQTQRVYLQTIQGTKWPKK